MNFIQDTPSLTIWQMLMSLMASFIGIQKRSVMERDMNYLEKRGFKLILVLGFGLLIAIHALIYLIVLFVLPEGSSWALF